MNPSPFLRVFVRYMIANGGAGSMLVWQFTDDFDDPLPHTFQLQGAAGSPVSTSPFMNIGLPVTNTYLLVDPGAIERRSIGGDIDFAYRIQLTTSKGVYYSDVINFTGTLDFRNWRIARDIMRKEVLRFDRFTAVPGWLLKKRRSGALCPRCADPILQSAADSRCPVCWGTNRNGGYYAAIRSFMDVEVSRDEEYVDPQAAVATIRNDMASNCRMLGDPMPDNEDVFVDMKGGRRFTLRNVVQASMIANYCIVATVEAHPIPPADIIYDFPVPETLE